MDRKTLAALRSCIVKYEKAAEAADEEFARGELSFSGSSCALCALHFSVPEGVCAACPVRLKTQKRGCRDTPWWGDPNASSLVLKRGRSCAPRLDLVQIAKELLERHYGPDDLRTVCDHLRKRCKEEAEFLKSLLPQWTRNKSKQI